MFLGIISHAQSFSNLKSDKLTGKVKSVRKEQTWTSNENGKYVESERVLMTVDNYDENGNKTEWIGHFGKGYPLRYVFICDAEGKIVKELYYNYLNEISAETIFKYNTDGNLVEEISSNGIKTVYTYDSKRNKISEKTYDLAKSEGGRAFGSVETTVYFHYYKNSKLKEVGAYNFVGVRVWNPPLQAHKIVYAYDSNGRIAYKTVFKEDYSIRSKARYFYDSNGVLIKEISFIDYNKVRHTYKYEYEVDEFGNWIKLIKSQQKRRNKSVFIPIETIYRTLAYY